ncbi:rhomboid family intramembrane serine protease [Konateibacter massiliensis]|uniref:rhomboid family intramembrane serine protease n=1 Tax=Konateibacter massiliensis TaxID=2002841 RepID=UPI000C1452E5|nr:rhomboid family intramembrane serine protease [Konateibacter massiliensis]
MFRELKYKIERNAFCTNLIVLINIMVFIVLELGGSTQDSRYMINHGAAVAPLIVDYGQYYRLFTSTFLHFGIEHLFNNMLVLFFLGDNLERAVGKIKFLIIYLLSGLGASALSCGYNYLQGEIVVSAGASGAIFGVIGALFYIVIVNKGRLEDMTSARLGLLVIFTLYHGFSENGVDNAAHIGGLICGIILAILLYRRKKHSCPLDSDIIQ